MEVYFRPANNVGLVKYAWAHCDGHCQRISYHFDLGAVLHHGCLLLAFALGVMKPLQNQKSALGHAASPPAGFEKAISRICAADCRLADFGIMPLIRPAVISDCVSLSDKL